MAKGRSTYTGQRGYSSTASYAADPLSFLPRRPLVNLLRLYEDRRAFHPYGPDRLPGTFRQRDAASITLRRSSPAAGNRMPRDVLQFRAPKQVLLCIRRQRRREVIHALGKAGSGSRARNRKRNEYSNISCR